MPRRSSSPRGRARAARRPQRHKDALFGRQRLPVRGLPTGRLPGRARHHAPQSLPELPGQPARRPTDPRRPGCGLPRPLRAPDARLPRHRGRRPGAGSAAAAGPEPSGTWIARRDVRPAPVHRRFNGVSLFTARRPSRDKRERLSALGLLLCTNLDCAVKMHSKPVRSAFDPPVEEIIGARREGMRSRTIAFIRSVSDTERTTRHVRCLQRRDRLLATPGTSPPRAHEVPR